MRDKLDKRPESAPRPGAVPSDGARRRGNSADDSTPPEGGSDATRHPAAAAVDHVREAFEPDVLGGPEAEPEPEHGDFCYPADEREEAWR